MLQTLRSLAVLALGVALTTPALAQGYPNKPVKIVVPFAAGSATDIMARIIAEDLRTALGQPFIIDNKPGGSAQIGAELVAKAPPDGYTLFVTTNTSHSASPYLFKKLNYDPVKDFAPVANIMRIPVILVVNPAAKINNLAELVAYAKANPGKASFGYGNSIGPAVIAFFAICGSRLAWVFLIFPSYRTFANLLLCYPLSWILAAVLLGIYYRTFMRHLRV